MIGAIPIIKRFIENDNISLNEKIYSIKAIGDSIDDQEYFQELFSRYAPKEEQENCTPLKKYMKEVIIALITG